MLKSTDLLIPFSQEIFEAFVIYLSAYVYISSYVCTYVCIAIDMHTHSIGSLENSTKTVNL